MHFKAASLEHSREISLLYSTKHLKGLVLTETVLLGSETSKTKIWYQVKLPSQS